MIYTGEGTHKGWPYEMGDDMIYTPTRGRAGDKGWPYEMGDDVIYEMGDVICEGGRPQGVAVGDG